MVEEMCRAKIKQEVKGHVLLTCRGFLAWMMFKEARSMEEAKAMWAERVAKRDLFEVSGVKLIDLI